MIMFQKFDTDGDGEVTLDEVMGPVTGMITRVSTENCAILYLSQQFTIIILKQIVSKYFFVFFWLLALLLLNFQFYSH